MRKNIKNVSRGTLPVITALALLSACAFHSKITSEMSPDIEKYHVKKVVVLPFDALTTPQVTDNRRPYDELVPPQGIRRSDMSVAVPPSGERYARQTAGVTAVAADQVTRAFYAKLKGWEGLNVYSPDDAAAALKTVAVEDADSLSEQQAAKVATKMSLDAAIVGRVLVYQERKGSRLGGETAAVGFEVKLVSTDGTVLWAGNYYEKQKPLTEDVRGAFERGFMFVTADELVEYGTTHLVDKFPFGAKAQR